MPSSYSFLPVALIKHQKLIGNFVFLHAIIYVGNIFSAVKCYAFKQTDPQFGYALSDDCFVCKCSLIAYYNVFAASPLFDFQVGLNNQQDGIDIL